MDTNFTPDEINNNNNEPDWEKKRLRKRFVGGMIVGCLVSVLVALIVIGGNLLFRTKGSASPSEELLSGETLSKIQTIEDTIDTYYLNDVDKEEEANGIYKGIVESLGDPYSEYYTQEELEELMTDTAGIYYGIGAYVSMDEDMGYPKISGVIPGTPAEAADLLVDDIIYEVDGVSTSGMELSDVVALIKGPDGTTVHIVLLRGSRRTEVKVDVQRSAVEVPTVTTDMIGENKDIGYLQISEFDDVTPDQFVEGMAELRENNMKGLILDLRSNPGGSVSAVCEVARQLLPKGLIVYTVDKNGRRDDYTCDGSKEIDIPVVVLVNQYSASASEILSGAIKDYGIGKLVGTTTFGKGIVQRIVDFHDGTAVKLTVSDYYTPNGNNIHGVGIEPDYEVEFDIDAYTEDGTDSQLEKALEVMDELL